MRLVLSRTSDADFPGTVCVLLLAINDSYEPVTIDRRLLIGPNPELPTPQPVSVEPEQPRERDNHIVLEPWCAYGRVRSFPHYDGHVRYHGYLVQRGDSGLLARGPMDETLLAAAADPLIVDSDD